MSKRENSKYKIDRRLRVNLWGRPKSPFNEREYGPASMASAAEADRLRHCSSWPSSGSRAITAISASASSAAIYEEAARRQGDTGENLVELLERRLDAVVYRAKFVPHGFRRPPVRQSRPCQGQRQARQHRLLPGEGQRRDRGARKSSELAACWKPRPAERDVPDYVRDHKEMRAPLCARRRSPTCPIRCRWSPRWWSSITVAEESFSGNQDENPPLLWRVFCATDSHRPAPIRHWHRPTRPRW